jgi:hypothetical protein
MQPEFSYQNFEQSQLCFSFFCFFWEIEFLSKYQYFGPSPANHNQNYVMIDFWSLLE